MVVVPLRSQTMICDITTARYLDDHMLITLIKIKCSGAADEQITSPGGSNVRGNDGHSATMSSIFYRYTTLTQLVLCKCFEGLDNLCKNVKPFITRLFVF